MLPEKFKKVDFNNKINLYCFSCEDTPYSRTQLLNGFKVFTDFMERFRCSLDEFCSIIDELGIPDKDLFEYTTNVNDFLVGKDLIYSEKRVKVGYSWITERKKSDVYVKYDTYVDLSLHKVAGVIVLRRFPWLAKDAYCKHVKRFNDNIKMLPKSINTPLNKINSAVLFDNEITIHDLIKLYTDSSYANSYYDKVQLSIYANGDIYLELDGCDNSLAVTIDNLYNKDWDAIEKKHVFSIPLRDEKGEIIPKKWFNGEQKDAPYFTHYLVETFHQDLINN